MTMRMAFRAGLAVSALLVGDPLLAHGGGLDSCGGHNNRKTGGYHVHNMTAYCACHPAAPGCPGAATKKEPAAQTPKSSLAPSPQRPTTATTAGADATQTVYVTKTGTKYHKAGCRSLARSSIPMSLGDAAARYGPCSLCGPPALGASTPPASTLTPASPSPRPSVAGTRCAATTKKGTQCSRAAAAGSSYCWQHGGK